ncbi:MAG: AzlD domain-containing protein [Synergistaceae bacterium]|nr:AzlD domain-containing protein [Synergistaceae bacterium]
MDKSLWIIIGGMALVTVLPRLLPIMLLSGRRLPLAVARWLSLIVPAILSALLFPELLFTRDAAARTFALSASNTFLMASVPTFFVAWKTKSLYKTIIAGIVAAAVLRFFVG